MAKPSTKAPHCHEQCHMIKICVCASEGKQNADSSTNNYNRNSESLPLEFSIFLFYLTIGLLFILLGLLFIPQPTRSHIPPSSRPRLLSHLVTFPTLPVHTNWPALFCNHRSLMMTPGLGSKHLFLDLCPQKRLAGVLSSEILHNLRYFQDSSNLISCANDN